VRKKVRGRESEVVACSDLSLSLLSLSASLILSLLTMVSYARWSSMMT